MCIEAPIPALGRPRATKAPIKDEKTMANTTTCSAIFGGVQLLHVPPEICVRDIPHLEAGRLRFPDVILRASRASGKDLGGWNGPPAQILQLVPRFRMTAGPVENDLTK
jgi:hypothetical protein